VIKPWIENCSRKDVQAGQHFDAGENSMLIQIADPATFFPVPKYRFKEIHQFEFLDAEDSDVAEYGEEPLISIQQAETIVQLLQHALADHMNTVVHCHAGICRSGAVAEIGVMMGFRDTEKFRSPNLRVKHKMMKILGLTHDPEEAHNWREDYRHHLTKSNM
jgi:predicted protein tyrosine phosphatase